MGEKKPIPKEPLPPDLLLHACQLCDIKALVVCTQQLRTLRQENHLSLLVQSQLGQHSKTLEEEREGGRRRNEGERRSGEEERRTGGREGRKRIR